MLVVDDQAPNRKLLASRSASRGYAVETAESGEEALAKVGSVRPDLVLLDVVMPGLSGYDVCRSIRADPATGVLPVVMVTALDPAQERIKGLEAGADDFLTKPINTPELLARVKSLLRVKTFHDTVQSQASELAELNAGLEKRVQEQLGELQRLAQLKRFFPPQLAERIVAGDVDDPLATHRREIAVVILDLRGFTAFADASEPEEVMSLLRRYHQVMGQLIQAHGGTLEQFSGGSMLVIFNDPVISEDPAGHAVRMALEMQMRFDELMSSWRRRGHDISVGIGIAYGYATIGAIGDEARVGYGAIGRVTNLAARLSAEAPPGRILVSASVYELVEALVDAEEADQVNLSGFARPGPAYRIGGLKPRAVRTAARGRAGGVQPQGAEAAARSAESSHRLRRRARGHLHAGRLAMARRGGRRRQGHVRQQPAPAAQADRHRGYPSARRGHALAGCHALLGGRLGVRGVGEPH